MLKRGGELETSSHIKDKKTKLELDDDDGQVQIGRVNNIVCSPLHPFNISCNSFNIPPSSLYLYPPSFPNLPLYLPLPNSNSTLTPSSLTLSSLLPDSTSIIITLFLLYLIHKRYIINLYNLYSNLFTLTLFLWLLYSNIFILAPLL